MKSKIFLAVFLGAALGGAQGLEKVDPFRQVTTQWVRPNLLLVLDISGSMRWDMFGYGVGTDGRGGATGAADKPSWTRVRADQCSGNKYKYYWQLQFRYPSRMAMVKNALGNSVTIWQPPSAWHDSSFWPNISGWTKSFSTGPTNVVKYTSQSCYQNPPPLPSQLANISIPDVLPPADLVGTTADKVNWGLVVYSTPDYANCQRAELVAKVDTLDTGDVTTIENAMKLKSAGGLPATGGTPTRGALEFAKTVMAAVKNGGTVTDFSPAFGGNSFTFSADPKKNCGRSYSVMLVTDGQSNVCNGNAGYCWQDPATGRCDGSSGYTCPNSLTLFPAQKSKELWQLQGIRTFAIGVSTEIGPCELNHVAFEGKTDASSPNGDAGFDTASDPRLTSYSVNDSQRPSSSNQPYAYFTTNAQEFRNAVAQILAALGTGDYVTSAPSVTSTSEVAGIGLLGTVDYPTLKGHLLAYNVSDPASFTLLWDAGEVLSSGNKGFQRKIYTWQGTTKILVPITTADAATATILNAICGGCGITPAVVDFMLGNNGAGSPRSWKLGAIVNSTPAVIGPPVEWKQATQLASARAIFQDTYKQRHPLVWVGSSDGMLHAFDLMDGAEILAIVPPDLLAKQVQLYNQFQQNPSRFPTGQPQLPDDHIYGVANSMRFADVFFPQGSGGTFKTVLFLTEGPGGTGIHALDITHVYPGRTGVVLPDGTIRDYPADPNFDATAPFAVLWGYTRDGAGGTDRLPNLRRTWGMPAVAMDRNETFYLAMPAGYLASDESDPDPTHAGNRFLFLRARDGQLVSNQILTPLSGNQYLTRFYPFADAAFWQTTAKRFQPDNYADQAVLGDLFGQLWALNDPFSSLTKLTSYTDANAKGSPLYYATAVAAYPMANPKWAVYASISGNFYEKSAKINPPPGWLSNPTLFHRSEIYLTALPTGTGVNSCFKKLRLDTLQRPDGPTGSYFSRRTQPTSYPLLLIPTENSSLVNALALFSVYDPDAGVCIGKTYLVIAEFNPQTCSLGATVYAGGEGASSGFVITPSGVLYAKSFVGQGGRAGFQKVPNLEPPTTGGEGGAVTWWREIQ